MNYWSLLVLLSLSGCSLAKPVETTPADSETAPSPKIVGPCSSKPYEEYPCGMTKHQGAFPWVTDSRHYEWIYVTFCATLGACIFIIVLAAAINSAKIHRRKKAELLSRIRLGDEMARTNVYGTPRRGSHTAHPHRDSLSVSIEDPASKKLIMNNEAN